MRALVAVGYTFAAWLFAGFFVDASYRVVAAPNARVALRCGAMLVCFVPVFRLYFSRPGRLAPAAASALAVAFIAALDVLLMGPYFARRYELFLSFWDWQLPALLVAGSVYLAGLAAR